MAGTKRSVDETGPTTRASKAAKTDTSTSPATKAAKGAKKGAKAAIPTSAFKAKALPLHVVLTHTPPAIPDAEAVPSATADPGFIGALTLVASSFSTGSYGWKGNKRITVELQNPEGGEQNEKEKVQVMLTINATVVGSKQAKGDEEAKEDEGTKEQDAVDVEGVANDEADKVDEAQE